MQQFCHYVLINSGGALLSSDTSICVNY